MPEKSDFATREFIGLIYVSKITTFFGRNLRNVKMCIVHFKFPFFSHFFTLTLPSDNRKRASCCRNKTTELWNRLTELS